MALNINANAAQKAEQEKIKAAAERKASLQPKTVVEKMQEQGPATLTATPAMVEAAQQTPIKMVGRTESNVTPLPSNRSGAPVDIQKQVEESALKSPNLLAQAAVEKEEQRIKPIVEIMPEAASFGDIANDGFGAAIKRADKFNNLFQDKGGVGGAYLSEPETITSLRGEETGNPLSTKALFDENGFNAGSITVNDRGQSITQVDPLFSRVMGIVTERFIGMNQVPTLMNEQEQTSFQTLDEETKEESLADEDGSLRRGIGNSQLGREIFREWKRTQNQISGRPTDDYNENAVDNDLFETIGTLAKEMYHTANPELYTRNTSEDGQTVIFQVTPIGQAAIEAGIKSAPDSFTNKEIPPSSAPRPVLEAIESEGERARFRKKQTTAVITKPERLIEEARNNMNSIAHGVDPTRRKLVFQLAIQALKSIEEGKPLPKLGNLFKIGPLQLQSFIGEQKRKRLQGDEEYDARAEMQKSILRLLEHLNTTARYSDRASHLDFVVQRLQTRMHVAQNRFNPQGIPLLRFVTGGLKPSQVVPNSNNTVDRAFKELYAVLFLGGKRLLPEERIKIFNDEWALPNHGKLGAIVEAGKQIKGSMITSEADLKLTALMKNITLEGKNVVIPPEAANVPPLQMPEGFLNDALEEGMDGLHLIEAAHELVAYNEGKPFYSNLNVEVDGITHGPGTNLLQLGSYEKAPYRLGVLRNENATSNLDTFTVKELYQGSEVEEEQIAGDIRDGMRFFMEKNVQAYAEDFAGDPVLTSALTSILKLAVQDRDNYLKKPPMTLAYGRLLKNLNEEVTDAVYSGPKGREIRDIIESPEVKERLKKKVYGTESETDVVVNFLHNILADAIDAELDPAVVQVGQLLRANAMVSSLTNEIITIKNALGFNVYIGARQSEMTDKKGHITIELPGGRKAGGVPIYISKPAGSAMRDGTPGGWSRGRIIPAVIQGIDGAWMNRMFTGSSWKDLNNTYMLPIMDAVKTNLAGLEKVRNHANNNWWSIMKSYNYVDEITQWTPQAINTFRDNVKNLDVKEVEIGYDTPYRMFYWLLTPKDVKGKPFPNLVSSIYDTMDYPPRAAKMPVKMYEAKKKKAAERIAKSIVPKLWGKNTHVDRLSPKALLFLFDHLISNKAMNVINRNNKTRAEVRSNRNKLLQMTEGTRVLQIDVG